VCRRVVYIILFIFLSNKSLGQRVPRDSFFVSSYRVVFNSSDYYTIYQGGGFKFTLKNLGYGYDFRYRFRFNGRVKVFYDIISSNFFGFYYYNLGMGIKL